MYLPQNQDHPQDHPPKLLEKENLAQKASIEQLSRQVSSFCGQQLLGQINGNPPIKSRKL